MVNSLYIYLFLLEFSTQSACGDAKDSETSAGRKVLINSVVHFTHIIIIGKDLADILSLGKRIDLKIGNENFASILHYVKYRKAVCIEDDEATNFLQNVKDDIVLLYPLDFDKALAALSK